jgi:hypothetical protein
MLIRPLPGVTGTLLLDALRLTENSVESVRGSGGTAVDRFNAYQRWANEEARRLGRLLRPADLDSLVTTPRYWTLQALDPATHGSLAAFIDLELDERLRVISETREELERDLARWKSVRGLVVVPDSNVLLHHDEYFDAIDWTRVVPARAEDVHVVIPLLVIDELDNQKRGARNNKVSDVNPELVRTRARVTLRKFHDLFTSTNWRVTLKPSAFPESGAVTVELLFDDPDHVRLSRADDELVDQARGLQDLSGRAVHLVTFDTGAALRGRAAGLAVIQLSQT